MIYLRIKFHWEIVWDALCDLVPFVQFKKHEKHSRRSDTLVTFVLGCFSCFLNFANGTKLHKKHWRLFENNKARHTRKNLFNPFQPIIAFYIETSHLICTANQVTGVYMKRNTELKWVDEYLLLSFNTLSAYSRKWSSTLNSTIV